MRTARRSLAPLAFAAALLAACADVRVSPIEDTGSGPRDASRDAASADDVIATPDAVEPDDTQPDDVPRPACTANNDFTIERSEIHVAVGATELFAVNNDGTTVSDVDTAGMSSTTGRVWDFSAARAEDHRVLDEVVDPAGQWWASAYPDATYAMPLDLAETILGVYRVSDSRVELLGTVSREMNRTNMAMTPPVIVMQFPLTEGATWSQTVNGNGFYDYTALANVTQYVFTVDAHGEVRTPAGRFPALRIRTDLDQSVPFTLIRRTQRTYTFVSECWGAVARIASVDNEMSVEFTTASEYRRLSL
jgi:hypothetical protein